jgi:sugar phosphate isomerase/epimerase
MLSKHPCEQELYPRKTLKAVGLKPALRHSEIPACAKGKGQGGGSIACDDEQAKIVAGRSNDILLLTMFLNDDRSWKLGVRQGNTPWQQDLACFIRWLRENAFEAIDLGEANAESLHQITSAGVRIGSVDLPQSWTDLVSEDRGKMKAAAGRCASYVRELSEMGVRNFFTILIPQQKERDRRENFALAVEGYSLLCRAIESSGAKIVIEGWPGRPPYYSTLACTPCEIRELLKQVNSEALGINYDPSHLVRLGIDPLRFFREFASRIFHVHAKDTQILPEGLYEFGNLQGSAVAEPHAFGGYSWRYTIPGNGNVPWPQLMTILNEIRYRGVISIELEDEQFNGSQQREQPALLQSRDYLSRLAAV